MPWPYHAVSDRVAGPETCPLKAEPRRTAPDPATGTATITAGGADVKFDVDADVEFDVDNAAKAGLDDKVPGRAPPSRRARVRERRALALVRYVPIEAFAAFGYLSSKVTASGRQFDVSAFSTNLLVKTLSAREASNSRSENLFK